MSAKSKDTTKTAHVMNLLRKSGGGTQTADPADVKQAAPAMQSDPISVPVKPEPAQHPIITSLNEEAAVSQEIKDALEQELMSEVPSTEQMNAVPPSTPEEPCQTDAVEQAEEPLQAEEEAEEDQTVEEEVLQAAEEEPLPEEEEPEKPESQEQITEEKAQEAVPAEPTPAASEPQVPAAGKEIFNVMQVLVEESAEKYMTMFNLCSCPRCKADVRALALNNLQPKYVVMEDGEYIPRITVYERQFSATVTAQILRACNVVAEFPRHGDLQ